MLQADHVPLPKRRTAALAQVRGQVTPAAGLLHQGQAAVPIRLHPGISARAHHHTPVLQGQPEERALELPPAPVAASEERREILPGGRRVLLRPASPHRQGGCSELGGGL